MIREGFGKFVIVDIDGTVADLSHRLKYYDENSDDFSKFMSLCHKDKPIKKIIDLVELLNSFYMILFCTSRMEKYRKATERWIKEHIKIPYAKILMRPNGDIRPDTVVKPELLNKGGIKPKDVAFILEDRDSVSKEWRRLGFTCLQVANESP